MDRLSNSTMRDVLDSLRSFGIIDYVIFTIMLVICMIIGIYFGFVKKQTKEDYLMGGRNMKTLPVALSILASYVSGITLLGFPTEMYVYGTQMAFMYISAICAILTLNKVFLPIYHELKVTSSYEYLERRFDKRMRLLGSILFTVSIMMWLPIVIYLPALAFNQVSGFSVHYTTPIVSIICIFYTCVGGIQAVVWTDVVQIIIMIGSMLMVVFKGTEDVGGMSVVFERGMSSGRIESPIWDINIFTRNTFWNILFGSYVNMLAALSVGQSMVQRYMALPSLKAATRSAWYYFFGLLLVNTICFYCGLMIYAKYHDCDPITTKLAAKDDQLLPLLVMDLMGSYKGFAGVFVAGVFSAALSSLSTGINSIAAVMLEDFYPVLFKKQLNERQAEIFMKSTVVISGAICVALVYIVEQLGTVAQLSVSLGSTTNGVALGIFLVGLFLPFANSKGTLIGSISGIIFTGWAVVGAQFAIANKQIIFDRKPVSTEGCTYSFDNTTTTSIPTSEPFILYQISYWVYPIIALITTVVVSSIASYVTRKKDDKVDPKLLAPVIRKWFGLDSYQDYKIDEETKLPLCKIEPSKSP